MALSPHLVRKLQEAVGHEAAEDIVSRFEGADSLRGDVLELRHEMQLGFARMSAQLDARFAIVDARIEALDRKLDQKIDLKVDGLAVSLRSEMKEHVAVATSRLLKWSFVFWVSAVGAIAGLAGLLR